MKKKSLLILPIAFLLSACTITDPSTWFDFLKKKENNDKPDEGEVIDGPDEMHTHATSLSQNPNAPFYLKVGEAKDISVTLSPSPDLSEEKIFTWSLSGDYIDYVVDASASNKVRVTGKSEGTSYLTATNTYNPLLTKTFTIKVIEVTEDDAYIWQYVSANDLKKFDGRKTGRANLAGIEWDFERSSGEKTGTYYGGMSMGGSGNPETSIKLKAHTLRAVKSISIEAASMNSCHRMSVKVGEKTFIDNETVERVYNNAMSVYSSDSSISPTIGDILIDISSDEYVLPEGMSSADYKGPGTFWLKSITIIFDETPEFVTEKTFNFKEMYDDENDEILHNLPGSATQVSFTEGNFEVTLGSVKKEAASDDKIPGYAHSNGLIDIKLNKADEVISKVEFKFTYGTSSSKNNYSLEVSKTGGAPYSVTNIANDSNGLLKSYIFIENVNAVRLSNQNNNNVGLEYLKVNTRSGVNGTVKGLVVPEKFEPSKKAYLEGELFDTAGLKDLGVEFNEYSIPNDVLYPNQLDWYDGTSYEANPATATKELHEGTTSVYGVFNEFNVKVSGITVEVKMMNTSLVKSTSELNATNKYYVVDKDGKALLKSSSQQDMKNANGVEILDVDSFGDSLQISEILSADYFVFEPNQDGFNLKATTGHYVGMTNSGSFSINKNADIKKYTITIDADNGEASFQISNKYLTFDGAKFCLAAEPTSLLIYKVVA